LTSDLLNETRVRCFGFVEVTMQDRDTREGMWLEKCILFGNPIVCDYSHSLVVSIPRSVSREGPIHLMVEAPFPPLPPRFRGVASAVSILYFFRRVRQ
jgi:hypothetical protein